MTRYGYVIGGQLPGLGHGHRRFTTLGENACSGYDGPGRVRRVRHALEGRS